MKGKEYTWHKVNTQTNPELGYQGDTDFGYTPLVVISDLYDVRLEEPLLDEMIPNFLEEYQKKVKKLIEEDRRNRYKHR